VSATLAVGYGERNEHCVSCYLPTNYGEGTVELEVLEVREKSNEIQDLLARALGLSEDKESKRWREVSEIPLDVWHKTGYLEIVNSEFLEVRECGKIIEYANRVVWG
jgi:hypothetical protein